MKNLARFLCVAAVVVTACGPTDERGESSIKDISGPVAGPILVYTQSAGLYRPFSERILEVAGMKWDNTCFLERRYQTAAGPRYSDLEIYGVSCGARTDMSVPTVKLRVELATFPDGRPGEYPSWDGARNTDWDFNLVIADAPQKKLVGYAGIDAAGMLMIGNLCAFQFSSDCDLKIDSVGAISELIVK